MMMALLFCTLPLHSPLLPSLGNSIPNNKTLIRRRRPSSSPSFSCMSSSSSSSSNFPTQKGLATNPFLDHPPSNSNYMLTRTTDSTTTASNAVVPCTPESTIERVIFDSRFLAILAVGGSLAGSLLCFLNGCIYIVDAYKVYWTSCAKGVHTGQMVLRLVEAIDVYLAGTVMLIFGMGLYGLFISNVPPGVSPKVDRALRGSSLFGMFALKISKEDGSLTESTEEVALEFLRYFEGLLGTRSQVEHVNPQVIQCGEVISSHQASDLLKEVTSEEIKEALFGIGNDKAPGPDGYTALFFKTT